MRLLIVVLICLVGVFILILLARRREEEVEADWETLKDPGSRRQYEIARVHLETKNELAGYMLQQAIEVRELGDVDEAIRLLGVSYEIIERFAPTLFALLSLMAKQTRMISAITPLPPLFPSSFRLPQLASLSYLHGALHTLVFSAKHRLRLRLYIIGKGISLILTYISRNIKSIIARPSEAEREWAEIEDCYSDFRALSRECLTSLSAVLKSMEVEEKKRQRTIEI